MKATMTILSEATDLEAALSKLDAKLDAAKKKATEKHVAKLRALDEAFRDDVKAIRGQFSPEAVALYDRHREAAGKAAE